MNVRMRENENQVQLQRLSRLQCALVHCTYLNCVWARTALQAYLLLDICTFSHFPFFSFRLCSARKHHHSKFVQRTSATTITTAKLHAKI